MDRLLANELFVRLLAIGLAILIYLNVAGQTTNGNVERTLVGVPVQTVNLPSDLAAVGTTPATVAITVSGSARLINALTPTGVVASVNMAAAKPGTAAYYVQVAVPPGIQPIEATPADVNVSVDVVIEHEAPLTIHVHGTPAVGFMVAGRARSSPNFVVLRGTARAIGRVTATVATVDVTGANATVQASVAVLALGANGQPVSGVQVVPATVSVTVPITTATPAKPVQVNPDVTGQPAAGYRIVSIQAVPPEVEVLGPAGALAGVGQVTTQPVSVAGDSSTVTTTALVVAPAGSETVSPASVQVQVVIARSGSS